MLEAIAYKSNDELEGISLRSINLRCLTRQSSKILSRKNSSRFNLLGGALQVTSHCLQKQMINKKRI